MSILNFKDEIIDGKPKYIITDNLDGTKGISLANSVIEEGTDINKKMFDDLENISNVYLKPSVKSFGGITFKDIKSTVFGHINNISTGEGMCSGNQEYMTFNISSSNTIKIGSEYVDDTTNIGVTSGGAAKYTLSDINSILKRTTYADNYYIRIFTKGVKSNILSFDFDLQRPRNCELKFRLKGGSIMGHTCVVTASNDNETWEQIAFYDNLDSNNDDAKTIPINNYRYIKCSFNSISDLSHLLYIYYLYLSNVDDKIISDANSNSFLLPYNFSNMINNERILIQNTHNMFIAKGFANLNFGSSIIRKLNDGNIGIIYTIDNIIYYGKISPTGEILQQLVNFGATSTSISNFIVLDDDNLFVVGMTGSDGSVVVEHIILNYNGELLKRTTENISYASYQDVHVLSNGNIGILYTYTKSGSIIFRIIDKELNIIINKDLGENSSNSHQQPSAFFQLDNSTIKILTNYFYSSSRNIEEYVLDLTTNQFTTSNVTYVRDKRLGNITLLNDNRYIALCDGLNVNNAQTLFYTYMDLQGNFIDDFIELKDIGAYKRADDVANGYSRASFIEDIANKRLYFVIGNGYVNIYDLDMNLIDYVNANVSNVRDDDSIFLTNNKLVLNGETNGLIELNYDENGVYTYEIANNDLNDIPIDTILEPDKYYELLYKQDQNKFLAFERRV